MNKGKKLAAAGALFLMAFAGASEARTIGGFEGQPMDGSTGCYTEWFGGVEGVCTGQYTWQVPLVVDTAGKKTVNITASAASTPLNCTVYAMGPTGSNNAFFGSSATWQNTNATQKSLIVDSVPSGGYLYVNCTFHGIGATIDAVNWNS